MNIAKKRAKKTEGVLLQQKNKNYIYIGLSHNKKETKYNKQKNTQLIGSLENKLIN